MKNTGSYNSTTRHIGNADSVKHNTADTKDVSMVMRRVGEQIGKAVTRLSQR